MEIPLKILILEDNATDAEIVQRLLKKENPQFTFRLAMNKDAYLLALDEFQPDVVLADNELPQFTGIEALEIIRRRSLNIPFILVTGSTSEEYAARIIKLGADDYVLKDRMVRLPVAIDAALKQRRTEKERREAQGNLIQSEKKYRTLIERVSDAFISLDKDFHYTYLNKKAAELIRRDARTVIGKCVWDVFPDAVGSATYLAFNKAMDEQKYISHTDYYAPLNLWQENHIYPSPDGLSVFIRDITKQKKAEEDILKERDLSDSIINSMPGIFYLFDETGEILRWNKNLNTVSGYSAAEIKDLHPLDFFDDDVKQLLGDKVAEAFERGMSDIEVPFFTKNKEKIPYYFTSWRILHEAKTCLIGIGIDITERKNAEKELQESHERYKYVSKATQDTIWEWNYHSKKGRWGEGIMKIFGYSEDKLEYGENWMDEYIHPSDKEEVSKKLYACIESKTEVWQGEYNFRCADGTYKYVYDRGFILYDEQGKPYRMIGALTDMTEKKRIERELTEQQINQHKLITETTIMAQEKERNELGRELHDNINQILVTVKIYLGLAKAKKNIPADLIEQSYEFVNEAIEEIRKLSHSLVAPSLGDVGLKEALQELADNAGLLLDMEVQLLIDDEYNDKRIDKNKELMFYRIVQEQLNNITKHAKANKVVITFKTNASNFYLSVADNGVGFDCTQKIKGIGLKNISNRVEFYSGNMNIISAPGQGCTLEVYIPI